MWQLVVPPVVIGIIVLWVSALFFAPQCSRVLVHMIARALQTLNDVKEIWKNRHNNG